MRLYNYTLTNQQGLQRGVFCVARTFEQAELLAEQRALREQSYVRCDSLTDFGPASFQPLERAGIFDTLTKQERFILIVEQVAVIRSQVDAGVPRSEIKLELDCR